MAKVKKTSYMNAIRDAIAEEMRKDSTVITMGEGIGERGGSYGHTKNLWQEFGSDRVIDTPISENGFTAMAVGAAACGLKPIVDLMFADIVYECMSQLAQQASKMCYMSSGRIHVPMVVRAQMGARATGPHHSACLYPLFMNLPGFKVVVPSNAYDAKGLMKSAIQDPNPVMFFEHKFWYNQKMELPEEEYYVPLGVANVVKEGADVTVVAISSMVGKVEKAIEAGMINGDVELIDPRTVWPLDMDTIIRSVEKTGRLVVVEEAHLNCNAGAEITTRLMEYNPSILKKPVVRCATANVPHAYSLVLEHAMVPNENTIAEAINKVLE